MSNAGQQDWYASSVKNWGKHRADSSVRKPYMCERRINTTVCYCMFQPADKAAQLSNPHTSTLIASFHYFTACRTFELIVKHSHTIHLIMDTWCTCSLSSTGQHVNCMIIKHPNVMEKWHTAWHPWGQGDKPVWISQESSSETPTSFGFSVFAIQGVWGTRRFNVILSKHGLE